MTIVHGYRTLVHMQQMPAQLEASRKSAERWEDTTGMSSEVDWEGREAALEEWMDGNFSMVGDACANVIAEPSSRAIHDWLTALYDSCVEGLE